MAGTNKYGFTCSRHAPLKGGARRENRVYRLTAVVLGARRIGYRGKRGLTLPVRGDSTLYGAGHLANYESVWASRCPEGLAVSRR